MTEWKESTLEELVMSPITYGVVKPGPIVKDGIQFIRGGDISGGKIAISSLRTISSEVSTQYTRTLLDGGELIISLVGNPGQVAIVPQNLSGANIARQVGLVRLSEGVDKWFVLYYLMSSIGKEELSSYIGGSVQQVINLKDLRNVNILLPPFPEQKAIASVLSSLDDKIDLLHRQNKTLEALAETLFRKWFIERRPERAEGDAKEDWEKGCLGDVIEIFDSKRIPLSKMQRNKMKDGKLYPYYGAATVMDYVNDYIFDGEYILLGEDGTVRTDEGNPVLQYATGKFWVNNHTHVIQAKPPYNNFFFGITLARKT